MGPRVRTNTRPELSPFGFRSGNVDLLMNKKLPTISLAVLAISGFAGWLRAALLSPPGTSKLRYVFGSSKRWIQLGRLILLAGPALCCSALAKTALPANPPEAGAEQFEVWHDERSWWLQNS